MSDASDFDPAELEGHRAFLQRLARALVRGEAAAEDLVQEAFARALERPPAAGRALGPWLGRVLRHLAINRARGAARVAEREKRVARSEAVPPPDEALASLELQGFLIAALKSLDEPYRTTLWLRFHEGLAPGAIAARQGTSKKTVEARLTRGLAALRADLDRRANGDRARWLGAVLLLARRGPEVWLLPIGVGMLKKGLVVAVALLALGLAWRLVALRARSLAPVTSGATREPVPLPAAERGGALEQSDSLRTVLEPVSRAPLAPARGSLLVRVRWADDGAPAPDVGLILHLEDDPRGERAVELVQSDAQGLVRLERVHPGTVRIEADRGGERAFQVAPGVETEAVFELAAGIDLEGSVSDATGAPIAGAELLLVAAAHDWLSPRVVARTTASGSYRIRGAQPELALSARAGDLAPALLRPLRGRQGRVRIDFVLAEPGAGLRGIVRDSGGRPVVGALVAVGDPEGYAADDPEAPEGWREARALRVERSDEHGRFFAPGVRLGFGLSVAVQADGHPIVVAKVDAEHGATSFVELTLAPPAVLRGIVRGPDGAPAAGVSLRTISCEGADANEIPFPLPRATSDEAGRFELEWMPSTSLLRLDPPRGSAHGPALVELVLAPGENWRELSLPADGCLRGRVVVPPGLELEGWFVRAYEQLGNGRIRRAELGADGRFELADCAAPPYRVELFAAVDRPVLRRDDVGPGPELVLVPAALGSIRGEWVDEAGLVPAGVPVEFHIALRPLVTYAPSWSADGRFGFEHARAGVHRLTIEAGEQVLIARQIELAPGQHVDLGRLVSVAPGSLRVELEPTPLPGWAADVRAVVLDAELEELVRLEPVGNALGVARLPVGDWQLVVEAQGFARSCTPFSVRAGAETRLALALEPGVERTLQFRLHARAWERLRARVHDAAGRLVAARNFERRYLPQAGAGPSLRVALGVGTFTLEAETDTGLALRTSFDVPALVEQDAALVFELR